VLETENRRENTYVSFMLLPAMPLCTPLAAKGNADVGGMYWLRSFWACLSITDIRSTEKTDKD
jgi:hypothetical protein